MAFIILLGFGLAASLFVSHLTYWFMDRWTQTPEVRDTRFDKDAKYARLFHRKPNRLKHA